MEVGLSVVVGGVFGFIMHYAMRGRNQTGDILVVFLGLLFLSVAISVALKLSPLLTNMAAGAVLINMSLANNRIFRAIIPITPPLYALFFVIAGTELNLGVLFNREILLLGSAYIIARAAGKYYGVKIGCAISKTDEDMKNYLGLCMIPQAGVAIGLVLLIQTAPQMQNLSAEHTILVSSMVNIVLLSVFVNELIGPPLSKFALLKGSSIDNCGRN